MVKQQQAQAQAEAEVDLRVEVRPEVSLGRAEPKTALLMDVTALPGSRINSHGARGVSEQPEEKLQT